jgi:hypothetical protein
MKAQRASPGSGGSACSEDGTTHTLIKIRSIEGYSGGKDGRPKVYDLQQENNLVLRRML